MQDMEQAFTQMGTPPLWPLGDEHPTRKRIAETTTPVPRGKKNTVPGPPPPPVDDPDEGDVDAGGDSETVAKLRKNERERQRRWVD